MSPLWKLSIFKTKFPDSVLTMRHQDKLNWGQKPNGVMIQYDSVHFCDPLVLSRRFINVSPTITQGNITTAASGIRNGFVEMTKDAMSVFLVQTKEISFNVGSINIFMEGKLIHISVNTSISKIPCKSRSITIMLL